MLQIIGLIMLIIGAPCLFASIGCMIVYGIPNYFLFFCGSLIIAIIGSFLWREAPTKVQREAYKIVVRQNRTISKTIVGRFAPNNLNNLEKWEFNDSLHEISFISLYRDIESAISRSPYSHINKNQIDRSLILTSDEKFKINNMQDQCHDLYSSLLVSLNPLIETLNEQKSQELKDIRKKYTLEKKARSKNEINSELDQASEEFKMALKNINKDLSGKKEKEVREIQLKYEAENSKLLRDFNCKIPEQSASIREKLRLAEEELRQYMKSLRACRMTAIEEYFKAKNDSSLKWDNFIEYVNIKYRKN